MQKNNIEKLFFQPTSHTEFYSVEITPRIAQRLLDMTDKKVQRKLKRSHVLVLSDDMKNGYFINNNGDTIRQDTEGNIIDGQHRLSACVEANYTLKTIFVKGLQTDTIKTIDIGQKTRTLTDVLEINHRTSYKYANTVTATVQFVHRFYLNIYSKGQESQRRGRMSTSQFLKWVDKNPNIVDFVAQTMTIVSNGDKLIQASAFCGLKWVLDKYNKPESDKFFQMLSDGIGLHKGSPVFVLRKRLMANKFDHEKRARFTRRELVLSVIKTWNCYLENIDVKKLFIPKTMPKIKSIKKL